jgi:hypothetical protein
VLLNVAALARIKSEAERAVSAERLKSEQCQRERQMEMTLAKTVCDVKVAEQRMKTESCKGDLARRIQIYEKAVKQCSTSPPWYKHPIFGFVVGQVVGGGLCIGASRIN